jgi:hypothetical protein
MRLPPMEKRKSKEAYPMPDPQHVAAAIGFAKMHHPGDTSLISRLRAKARRKFPGTKAAHGGRAQAHVEGKSSKHRLDRHQGKRSKHRLDRKGA